jgi:hypothetical protein
VVVPEVETGDEAETEVEVVAERVAEEQATVVQNWAPGTVKASEPCALS